MHSKILDRLTANAIVWSREGEMKKRFALMGVTRLGDISQVLKRMGLMTQLEKETKDGIQR